MRIQLQTERSRLIDPVRSIRVTRAAMGSTAAGATARRAGASAVRPAVRRVLLIAQPTGGGVAESVWSLVNGAVATRAFMVTVACPPCEDEASDGRSGDLPDRVVASGAEWIALPFRRGPHPSDIRALKRLRSLACRFDLLHLHAAKAGALGRIAIASLRPQQRPACIYTPHGWSWLLPGVTGLLYKSTERLVAPLADAIIAVSQEDAAVGARTLGAQASRIRIIENGVDPSRFRPSLGRRPLLGRSSIVCVGRLTAQKGQDVAIRALAAMRSSSTTLSLVGSGPARDALMSLAADLGMGHRVEFVGQVDDTAAWYRQADVVVVPSRWKEGCPYAALEALASGVPVVMTDVPGSAVVRGCGTVVPQGDAPAMAEALDALVTNDAARDSFGRAGRAKILRDHSSHRSVQSTLDLWAALARPPSVLDHTR